jgi:hypothetical protein
MHASHKIINNEVSLLGHTLLILKHGLVDVIYITAISVDIGVPRQPMTGRHEIEVHVGSQLA